MEKELKDVIKQFEDRFKYVAYLDKVDEDPSLPMVCSGGVIDVLDLQPALYSDKKFACDAWLREATGQTPPHHDTLLEWVYWPELLEFQMTMTDRIGQHRVVTNRYAVKAQFRTE